MISCYVCGSELGDEARSCPVCGTSVEAGPPTALPPPAPVTQLAPPLSAVSGPRACPACGKRYDAAYADSFCDCGTALVADTEPLPDIDLEPARAPVDLPLEREEARTAEYRPRLVVYSADRQPIHTVILDRDVTRIGRTDAVRGDFVDLDVSGLFDAETARKVSRKHCVVLRSRETQAYSLRPLAGNTGTQVGSELAAELTDYPLEDGTRIVLGGVVRIKFVTS
jgi:hypothetical protein